MVYIYIQSMKALEMRIFYHIFNDFSNLYLTSIELMRLDVHTILLEIEVKIIFETRNPIQNQFKLLGRRRGRSGTRLTWTSFLLQGPTDFFFFFWVGNRDIFFEGIARYEVSRVGTHAWRGTPSRLPVSGAPGGPRVY